VVKLEVPAAAMFVHVFEVSGCMKSPALVAR
jgi:hypothetical protein